MIRNIVRIDAARCNGCGRCADACSEGAIRMIDGKAVLVRESYCDGLGACLPACPTNAITIEEREAEPYSEDTAEPGVPQIPVGGIPMACPGSGVRRIPQSGKDSATGPVPGRLSQWPIQLRLVPPSAPFFKDCDLLVAADCSAFAYGDYHDKFIKGRVTVIGCPKLDPADSWNKLDQIIRTTNIRSITVTRMDVPCCNAIVKAVMSAVAGSGREIPLRVATIYPDGKLTESPVCTESSGD